MLEIQRIRTDKEAIIEGLKKEILMQNKSLKKY